MRCRFDLPRPPIQTPAASSASVKWTKKSALTIEPSPHQTADPHIRLEWIPINPLIPVKRVSIGEVFEDS